MAKSQKPKSTRKPPVVTPEAPPASAATLTPATPDPAPEPSEAKALVRKRSFVDRVMVEAGVKRGEAKAMSEAVLKVLGEALSEGEELSIPPLGKLKINRQFEKNGDEILVVKLRRPSGMLEEVAAEANAAENSRAEQGGDFDENPLAEPEEGR
ncbi:HU family DNA-binding protein [Thioclava electrotropha]|uniref:DNA-binding protein n=1 Tax=Thioclava electrotropha TaxID=1549850 RepID=A0ABX6YUR5_9RHOB|nr:HU family DNA-binding protein [Thioclava electrotropha]QPZ91064.1 hypothetical protein AKL02_009200 [Thioclava electrotropha]